MPIINGSLNHTYSGRRRKVIRRQHAKPTKFQEYKPKKTYASLRSEEAKCYPSCTTTIKTAGGTKKESSQYTGTYIIGIATMHKSNAVPVTNKEYAKDISKMSN